MNQKFRKRDRIDNFYKMQKKQSSFNYCHQIQMISSQDENDSQHSQNKELSLDTILTSDFQQKICHKKQKFQLNKSKYQTKVSNIKQIKKISKVVNQHHICTITPSLNIIFNLAEIHQLPPFTFDIVFDQNISSQKVIAYQYQTVDVQNIQIVNQVKAKKRESANLGACLIMVFSLENHPLEKLIQNDLIKTMILMSKSVTIPRKSRVNSESNVGNRYKKACKMIKKLLKNRFKINYQQEKGYQYYKITLQPNQNCNTQNQFDSHQIELKLSRFPYLIGADFQSFVQLQKSSYLRFNPIFQSKTDRSGSRSSSLVNSRNTVLTKNQQDGSEVQLFYILFQKKIQNSFQYCLNYFKCVILPNLYEKNQGQFLEPPLQNQQYQDDIINFYNFQINQIKNIYRRLVSQERFSAIIGTEMCQQIKHKLNNFKYKYLKKMIWEMIVNPKVTTVPEQQIQNIQAQIVQNIFQQKQAQSKEEESNINGEYHRQFDKQLLLSLKRKAQSYSQLFIDLLNQLNLCVIDKEELSKQQKISLFSENLYVNKKFQVISNLFFQKLMKNQFLIKQQIQTEKESKKFKLQSKAYDAFVKIDKLFMQDNLQQQTCSNLKSQQMLLQNITEKDQVQSINLVDQIFKQYSKISLKSSKIQKQYQNASRISITSKQTNQNYLKQSIVSNSSNIKSQKNDKKIPSKTYISKPLNQEIKQSNKSISMIKKSNNKPLLNFNQKTVTVNKSGSASSIMTPKSNNLHKTSISKSKQLNQKKNSITKKGNKQNI